MSDKVDQTELSCSPSGADNGKDPFMPSQTDQFPTEDADSNGDSPDSSTSVDSRHACSKYYKSVIYNLQIKDQYRSMKVEKPAENQCVVGVVIDEKLNNAKTVGNVMKLINHHGPGLWLIKCDSNRCDQEIIVSLGNKYSTLGSIKSKRKKAHITLNKAKLHEEYLIVHEFLHALGFEHEHQREGAKKHLDKNLEELNEVIQEDMIEKSSYKPMTPYDPYSIMHYPLTDDVMQQKGEETAQYGKLAEDLPNKKMSELDKVALNMMYPPVISVDYKANEADNGMHYCGRLSMINHNHPGDSLIFWCKPGGPNCPACRVLSSPKIMRDDQWQGWSGWVYCGKNGCGPHYGHPCDDCRTVVGI